MHPILAYRKAPDGFIHRAFLLPKGCEAMAKFLLAPMVDWDTLPVGKVIHWVDRDVLLSRLADIRAEWVEVAGSLEDVTVNLALVFDDLAAAIGRPDEDKFE